ncbi:disintegrin and metalloproteinase domain-containing protein 8-like isoform X1 [Stegostoma tigrinum]|uniref:disintegrin and metalloproteinase domain-containing protein 8-like isoform X1 n=2 Tax=Stegostoma tigrinum TaxID=3053191 RepID=UPI00202AE7A1|nr:disintegrin and metalloproteinase domain-containing protein 8-like isoform X1 [Stegostoma tigrinum]
MPWAPVTLVSLIICSTCAARSPGSDPLPGVEKYEIVKPRLVDSILTQRDQSQSEIVHPEKVTYSINLEGKEVYVHLEKNGGLLVDHYSETHYLENGTEVVATPQSLNHCNYHGVIEGISDSSVSISTCTGLRGALMAGSNIYLIEPLERSQTGQHALYRQEHLRVKRGSCSTRNLTLYDHGPKMAALYQPLGRRSAKASQSTRYVELYLVVDNTEYKKFRHLLTIRQRMMEVVNHVDKLYRSLNIRVALVGLEVWTYSDKIAVSSNPDITLDNFLKWRQKELLFKKRHDNAQFVTGIGFEGTTVGLATKSAMCSYQSGGVNEDHNSNPIGLASTIAHEMGHNLGMSHDEDHATYCSCSGSSKSNRGCIMAEKTGYLFPESFSSCSHQELKQFLASGMTDCLLNSPRADELYGNPTCGNQFLERGEECDCGSVAECTNPCCNATTCKFKEGAECAAGACCQNCKIKTAGQICRSAQHDCDLPDYCNGESAECPEDAFKMNGSPCSNGEGYCYNGQCPTHQQHCVTLWGTGAMVAHDDCFQQNMRGDKYGHCKAAGSGYDACRSKDVKCGKMHCIGGNKFPITQAMYEVKLSWNKLCRVATINERSDSTNDPGLVPSGTKCGDGMVCYHGFCQSVVLYGSRNCSGKCNNHGVCNHKRECHCDAGWAPPYCLRQNGSLSTGNAATIILSVVLPFIILLFLISGALLYYKKCLMKNHTSKISCGLSNPTFERKDRTKSKAMYSSNTSPHVKHSLLVASSNDQRPQITVIPKRPPPQPPKPAPLKSFSTTVTARPVQQKVEKPHASPPVPPSKQYPPSRVPVVKPTIQPPLPPVKPCFPAASSKYTQVGYKPKVALKPPNLPR